MKSFLTGSHVYGKPTKDSDIDLVVRISLKDEERLIKLSDNQGLPIRFGNLNLIAATTDEDFAGWSLAKHTCVQRSKELKRKLTKEESLAIHEDIRATAYLSYGSNSK